MSASYQALRSHLAYLRLHRAGEVLAHHLEAARKERLSHASFLERLLAEEVEATKARRLRGRLRFAHFPVEKRLRDFDFDFQPSVDRGLVEELAQLAFLEAGTHVLLMGPPGVGKTHCETASTVRTKSRERIRVVSGERRLRASSWGAVHLPDNPHFEAIPAVICPGPLSEEERQVWQLVENLAREDLRPGELAAALLYERCALLTSKLLAAGVPVPEDVAGLDDPVDRFRALDRLRVRAGHHHLGAPWAEVLRRLGIQMGEDRARQLARAFAALPAELSAEMDAAGIALATRLDFIRLDRGRRAAARELWEAVKARGRPELLSAAVRTCLERPGIDPGAALDAAEALHRAADEARARSQRRTQESSPMAGSAGEALVVLRRLLAELREGAVVSAYDAGSLRLCAEELLELLAGEPEAGEAVA